MNKVDPLPVDLSRELMEAVEPCFLRPPVILLHPTISERMHRVDSLGTYYVSPIVDIQQAKDLHAMQTKLACKALFERNPEGLDNPELFKQLFLRDASQVAEGALNKTKAEFEAKSLHQKVEV